jgi:lysophospholipase L1-like esterase
MRKKNRFFYLLMISGFFCALAATLPSCATAPVTRKVAVNIPWDWSGVIGTGQSLAVGDHGKPIKSTNQPYGNLKLSTADLPWPVDADDTNLSMVPLVEPVGRMAKSYPSSWPNNISGETPHSTMANEISALVKAASGRDFIGVHGEVGENGQCMTFLKKNATPRGVNGRSYQAAMIETKAVTRLAKAAGKTYGIGAIIVTHGECDAGNKNYENDLYQLWSDYNADLSAITGQTQKIQMIVSQQNAVNDHAVSTLAQWKVGVDHPAEIVCSGPKYQYPSAEGIHLTTDGYQQLGEKYGQVYYERVVLGHNWQPLQPTTVERNGAVFTIHYHVPVPPLVWETEFQPPHPSVAEWKSGKGFEVTTSDGVKVAIASAEISGDAIVITCATNPGANARVGYAMVGEKPRMTTPFNGTFRWGLLRDSDPFVGDITKKAQPNYGVAFEMPVP